METEVKTLWYLGLDQKGGSTLFYNEQARNWSLWRSEATTWLSEYVANEHLATNKQRNNVPLNTRVVTIKITIEEVV